MDIESLQHSPVGQLVPISGTDGRTMREYDYVAFLPMDLPDTLTLSQATWTAVANAAGALGQLRQVCAQIPNPQLLIAPALAKEAQATSALEGTYGALPEVLEARLPGFEPRTPEIREIVAYEAMAKLGFEWVKERPITVRMLCDLQRILAESSRQRPPDPGQVRTRQVAIGPDGGSIQDARFVPPPPGDQLTARLHAWEVWIRTNPGIHVLVRSALAHYQFETIHPFADCNGRVGRLVILLQLLQEGVLEEPSLTISPWLLRRREEYQAHLLEISRSGEWNSWVQFLCRAFEEQAESHLQVASRLLTWMADLRRTLDSKRWTGVILPVAESLADWPVITNRSIQERYNVKPPAAQSALNRLEEVGAIRELTGGSYGRIYGAHDVMAMVESL